VKTVASIGKDFLLIKIIIAGELFRGTNIDDLKKL